MFSGMVHKSDILWQLWLPIQLLFMMLPIRPYMILHCMLLRCLLRFPGWCIPGFPRLYESGGSRWPCLGFILLSKWGLVYLCLWLYVLWFVMIFRWCCLSGYMGRVFLVQGWSVCGWPLEYAPCLDKNLAKLGECPHFSNFRYIYLKCFYTLYSNKRISFNKKKQGNPFHKWLF